MDNISAWLVPLLSSIVSVVVTVLTCRWQLRTELRKISENIVSDKKYRAYYNAVNLFYTVMSEVKNKGTSGQMSDKFQDMLKVKEDLFVYGSDEAFRAFTNYLCTCTSSSPNTDSFKPFFEFMLVIRKEISGGKSTITTDDIMLNITQSKEELRKYHEVIDKQESAYCKGSN